MKKEQEESLNLEIIQACLKSENNRIRKGETNYGPKCVIYRENIKYVANSACLFRLVAKNQKDQEQEKEPEKEHRKGKE